MNKIAAVWTLTASVLIASQPMPAAETLFRSEFSGEDRASLAAHPDWRPAWLINGDGSDAGAVIFANMGEWFIQARTTTNRAACRARPLFHPATARGLRFQITLRRMYDFQSPGATNANTTFTQYLTPVDCARPPAELPGPKLALAAIYHRNHTDDISRSTIELTLRQMNGPGNGAALWTLVLPHLPIESTYPEDQAAAVTLRLELRDVAGQHLRVGYEITGAGGGAAVTGWRYSPWFDLTTGEQAFPADWAASWANHTRWYLEGVTRPGAIGVAFVDDAAVETPDAP